MKIVKVRSFVVGGFRCNWIFVKVYTDAGIDGVGEATLEFNERAVVAAIDSVGETLVGKDPFPAEVVRDTLIRDNYWRTNVVLRAALSGIEGALYDIKGKSLNVPVYDLLGGRRRDRIRVYANTWRPGDDDPRAIAERAARIVASGFPALKFDPFFPADLHMDAAARRKALDIVAAVRQAIGEDTDLLIEGHGRFDVHTAIMIANLLEPFRPYWFEEPVGPESISALADVRRRSRVPIAAGERVYDLFHAQDLLRAEAVDVLQPDVCHIGGIGELHRIGLIAHAHMRPLAPHNVNGPVGNAMTLHAAAALPNAHILETCSVDAPWRPEITTEKCEIVDGEMLVPSRPGLGIELCEAALEKYPPRDFAFHHFSKAGYRTRRAGAVPWYTMGPADRN
mgnify:CR=1 FL=1